MFSCFPICGQRCSPGRKHFVRFIDVGLTVDETLGLMVPDRIRLIAMFIRDCRGQKAFGG